MPVREEVKLIISAQDKASTALNNVGGAIKGMIASIVSIQSIKSVLVDSVKEFINFTTQIDKMSKITGIATTTLQRLGYAAEQEHSSIDGLNMGMRFLIRNMGAGKEEFSKLGISITNVDGTLRSVESVFYDVANAVANAKTETEASSIALKLLGRSGSEMVPFLRLGGEEIKRLGDEAKDLGVVLDSSVIKQGKLLEDEFHKVNASVKGVRFAIAEGLIPPLKTVSELLLNAAKGWREFFAPGGEDVERRMNAYKDMFHVYNEALKKGTISIDVYRQKIMALNNQFTGLAFTATESVGGAIDTLKDMDKELDAKPKPLQAVAQGLKHIADQGGGVQGVSVKLKHIAEQTKDSVDTSLKDSIQTIKQFGREFVTNIIENFIMAKNLGESLGSVMKMAFSAMLRMAIGAFLPFKEGGLVPGLQHGGLVTQGVEGRDSVLARLSKGEFVMPSSAVKNIGLGNLENMRHGGSGGTFNISIAMNSSGNPKYDARMLGSSLENEIKELIRRRKI